MHAKYFVLHVVVMQPRCSEAMEQHYMVGYQRKAGRIEDVASYSVLSAKIIRRIRILTAICITNSRQPLSECLAPSFTSQSSRCWLSACQLEDMEQPYATWQLGNRRHASYSASLARQYVPWKRNHIGHMPLLFSEHSIFRDYKAHFTPHCR